MASPELRLKEPSALFELFGFFVLLYEAVFYRPELFGQIHIIFLWVHESLCLVPYGVNLLPAVFPDFV